MERASFASSLPKNSKTLMFETLPRIADTLASILRRTQTKASPLRAGRGRKIQQRRIIRIRCCVLSKSVRGRRSIQFNLGRSPPWLVFRPTGSICTLRPSHSVMAMSSPKCNRWSPMLSVLKSSPRAHHSVFHSGFRRQSYAYDGFGNLTNQTVTKGSAPTLSVSYDPRPTGGRANAPMPTATSTPRRYVTAAEVCTTTWRTGS